MTSDLVSIITPAYNAAHFISDTIESVLCQSYQNWELIIVDDKSRDSTGDIVKEYQGRDSRIKYIEHDVNKGPAGARNTGLENAQGRYIAFLDSDDIWKQEKLQKQIDFMSKNNCGFCFSSYRRMSEDGSRVSKPLNIPAEIRYEDLLKNTTIGTLTVVLDKKLTGKIYAPENVGYDDFAMWLYILKKGLVAKGIKEDLALYRIMNKSISSNKIRAARWVWNILVKHEKLPRLKALMLLSYYLKNGILKESMPISFDRSSLEGY